MMNFWFNYLAFSCFELGACFQLGVKFLSEMAKHSGLGRWVGFDKIIIS